MAPMNALLWVWGRIEMEPAGFIAVIRVGLLMLTAFGLRLTPEQMALTLTFSEVVLQFFTRQLVTPNATAAADTAKAVAAVQGTQR
jgi:hypothetical protein